METFKNTVEYFALLMGALMILAITTKQLQFFQQSQYQFRSIKKYLKYYYLKDWTNFLPPLIIFFFFLDLWYIQISFGLCLAVLLFFKIKRHSILKLKYTRRIKRLILMIIIVLTFSLSILAWLLPLPHLSSGMVLLLLILPILILFSEIIIQPLESLISRFYIQKAKKKLSLFGTEVIGITGSYGKTGTKSILFSFLKDKYFTFPTEASYNTMNGVALSINRNLKSYYQFFISEMGATKKNDIEKLSAFVKPKYGIITTIGPQHLETFKSIDNILEEKIKLIENLPSDGIGIVNYDNKYLKKYRLETKCKLITFGLESGADYQGSDLKANLNGLQFKIKYKKKEVLIKTPLLGTHNVYNILAAFALASELGIPENDLVYQSLVLEPVKNRLSVYQEGLLTIIDDAFNSNHEGFLNALEVLSYYKLPKVLITPGIVEGGKEEERINYSLAKKIAITCNQVLLIKTKATLAIKRGLDNLNYQNVEFVDNFKKALESVKEQEQEAVVLIENDISDIYKI
ncbi:MAG: UDP-N-acetylmuramoyl-tripeptide--D-alanyl-D-alanine ligase [Bacilli bacterium]|nr:UDP-N-acetylmuramoyl-tripeptide--D-alanyl-D-alanine ligase [Bacilli bacterium]